MITITHSYSNLIYKDDIDFVKIFSALNNTRGLLKELVDACESEDFDIIFDLSDEIIIDRDIFELYYSRFISNNAILNHSLRTMYPKVESFADELQDSYSLNRTKLPEFKEKAKYVCGVYATLLYFDFNLNGLLEEDPVVESCVIPCLSGIDASDFMQDVVEEIYWCRSTFDIFEMYPQFEEDFYSIMGPEAALIDSDELTLEQVQDVVNGIITAEDLLEIHLNALASKSESLSPDDLNEVNMSDVFK